MLYNTNKINLSSPIKWAGGKTFLINKVKNKFEEAENRDWLVEVFAGSLTFTLYFQPKKVIINDICFPLINMWEIIKEYPQDLLDKLNKYNNSSYNNQEKFYEIRDLYNELKDKEDLNIDEKIELAGIFIYLNKRSFNGLYRENSSGKYNVPYRKYTCDIYNKENILNISKYFNQNEVIFHSVSFEDLVIPDNSFIYLDPPYYPSSTSSFTQYNKLGFSEEKQVLLRDKCVEWNVDNMILQSNAPCKEVEELYSEFTIEKFYVKRSMRSAIKGKKDEDIDDNELLIFN